MMLMRYSASTRVPTILSSGWLLYNLRENLQRNNMKQCISQKLKPVCGLWAWAIELHGPEVLQKKNEDLHIQQSIDFTMIVKIVCFYLYCTPNISRYLSIMRQIEIMTCVLAYVARHDPTMRPSWGADSFEGQHAQQAWTRKMMDGSITWGAMSINIIFST